MKITQITYGKTINIGNYQLVRLDFTAEVEPGCDERAVLHVLKQMVASEEVDILKENKK